MKYIAVFILSAVVAFAAIGDNAPSIPASYLMSHPRLPIPSVADLNNIYNNVGGSPGSSRYKTAADAWNIATSLTTSFSSVENWRYLVVWYMACKQNTAACATAYGGGYQAGLLAKIQAITNAGGGWGPILHTAADGIGAGTNCGSNSVGGSTDCSLRSNSTNFATACGGVTCDSNNGTTFYVGINGYVYVTGVVSTASGGTNNVIALHATQIPPSGTGLTFGDLSGNLGDTGAEWMALPYDWFYSDLSSAAKQLILTDIDAFLTKNESNYIGQQLEPFSDTFYTRASNHGLMLAVAAYPDDPAAISHLRFQMDVYLNIWLPVFALVNGSNCPAAENDAGTANSGSAHQPGCGLWWQDGWSDYVNASSGNGLVVQFTPNYLSWSTAIANYPAFFTVQNGYIKNFAHYMMYKARPDYVEENINAVSRQGIGAEYSAGIHGSNGLGILDFLAATYNDPTLRGWARCVNIKCGVPDGYEPTAWPWGTPDNSGNTATGSPASGGDPRQNLAKTRDFPGGYLNMRTGWTENDTSVTLGHGDSFWSHPTADFCGWGAFSRGQLAIFHASNYRAGSAAQHWQHFATQSSSFGGCPILYDPNDRYPSETYLTNYAYTSSLVSTVLPNAGGGRIPGGTMSNGGTCSGTGNIQGYTAQPPDIGTYKRTYPEFWNRTKPLAYQVGTTNAYTFYAYDMTNGFNNHFSQNPWTSACQYNTAGENNRSFRATRAVRHLLFYPVATSAIVIDYVGLSKNPANVSNIMTTLLALRTVNLPTISGNLVTSSRTELVSELPFQWSSTWSQELANCNPSPCGTNPNQYQYAGTMKMYNTWAGAASGSTPTLTTVGGTGSEFLICDSAGCVNYNQCGQGQCQGPSGGTVGSVAETFAITTGVNDTLPVAVDSGGTQTITLTAGGARTAAQVVSDINATLTGAVAFVEGNPNRVGITSNTTGSGSKIQILSGNADAILGLTVGTYTGGASEGVSSTVSDYMHPVSTSAPHEPGSYSVIESVCPPNATLTACASGANHLEDYFINVYWFTQTGNTVTFSIAPSTSYNSGTDQFTTTFTLTISGQTCAVTMVNAAHGVGDTFTALGAGCPAVVN